MTHDIKEDGLLSEAETAQRRDDALRRALSMPPKPNKPDSAGDKKKAAPKGHRPKSSS